MTADEIYEAHVRDFGQAWADRFRADNERYDEIVPLKEVLFAEASPKDYAASPHRFAVSGVLYDTTLSNNDYIMLANGGPANLGGICTVYVPDNGPTTVNIYVNTD